VQLTERCVGKPEYFPEKRELFALYEIQTSFDVRVPGVWNEIYRRLLGWHLADFPKLDVPDKVVHARHLHAAKYDTCLRARTQHPAAHNRYTWTNSFKNPL
jgi:hypothetical protein